MTTKKTTTKKSPATTKAKTPAKATTRKKKTAEAPELAESSVEATPIPAIEATPEPEVEAPVVPAPEAEEITAEIEIDEADAIDEVDEDDDEIIIEDDEDDEDEDFDEDEEDEEDDDEEDDEIIIEDDDEDEEDDDEDEDEDDENDPAPRPGGKIERLQKILASAGIASRRHAEELIAEGRVLVNGKVVTTPGSKADVVNDHIRVDGKLLRGAEKLRYFMLNKPKGFVTTVSDPEGRPTVMSFFTKATERLYPVGRLDYLSEGLLLVTNDGELANKLTKAASGVEKTYLVKVSGQPTEEEIDHLRGGVTIDIARPGSEKVQATPVRIQQIRQGDNPWFEVVLIEGRNRELRKMFEEIGHFVEKIRRVGYGPLILDQEPGNYRELFPEEVLALRQAADGKLKPRKVKGARMLPKEAGRGYDDRRAGGGRGGFDKRRGSFGGKREGGFGGRREGGFGERREGSGFSRPNDRPAFNREDRPSFNREGGERRSFEPRGEFRPKPEGFRPRRDEGDRPRTGGFKPRFERPAGEGGGFNRGGDRPRFERSDRPNFERREGSSFGRSGDRPAFNRDSRPGFNNRSEGGEGRSFAPRGDFRPRREEGDRPRSGEFKPRFERPAGEGGERKPSFGQRSSGPRPGGFNRGGDRPRFERSERPNFERREGSSSGRSGDRPAFNRDSRPGFNNRSEGGERRSFAPRGDFRPRREEGDRPRSGEFKPRFERPAGEGGERRSFSKPAGSGPSRGFGGKPKFGGSKSFGGGKSFGGPKSGGKRPGGGKPKFGGGGFKKGPSRGGRPGGFNKGR